jgi:hypothetical protein
MELTEGTAPSPSCRDGQGRRQCCLETEGAPRGSGSPRWQATHINVLGVADKSIVQGIH